MPTNRLSKLFSDALEEEHIYIVVRAPRAGERRSLYIGLLFMALSSATHSNPSPGPPSTDHTLQLNCLVQGDNLCNAFSVEIASTKNASALQKAIRKEKEHAFKGVDADTLVLWKVSMPADGPVKQDPRIHDLDEDQSLSLLEELSEVFSALLPRNHIHIVVRAPPVGEYRPLCRSRKCQF
jgi:hypothetical protein